MKFISKAALCDRPFLQQLLLTMKLTAFILLLALMQVSAKSYSQGITLKKEEASVTEILKLIEQQSGYHFLFDKMDIEKASPITVDLKNVSIEEALKKSLENQPLSFKIMQRTIVLKGIHRVVKSVATFQQFVSGVVRDEKGLPLQGVSIKIKGTNTGTTSNVDGLYKLSISQENATLLFSYIGYVTQEVPIKNQNTIDITLK